MSSSLPVHADLDVRAARREPAAPRSTDAEARLRALDEPAERDAFTRWEESPDGVRTGISDLRVSGIVCAACSGIIEGALEGVDGVLSARVNGASARAQVRWDPRRTRASAIVAAVEAAGYGAAPDAAAPAAELRRREHRRALWRLFVAAFCMMQVMMVAVPTYVAAPGEIDPAMVGLLNRAAWLFSVPVLLFAAGPFFSGAWQALRRRRIGMDVPVAIGVLVTFVASSGATFAPGGAFGTEVYFDSLTMFVCFLLAGRYLELRARHGVAETLEATMAGLPELATRVAPDGAHERVPCARLVPGDRVLVPAGEAVPADGTVLEGATRLDEALLTGESRSVVRTVGDGLVAGSLNVGSPVLMRVERVGADTRQAAIVALMRHALNERPAAAREADRWAGPFLWGVLLLAAGAAAAWSVVDPARAVWVAVAVLVVTCPCALSLATPSALLAAAAGLARRGVLLRRVEAIETLARVDRVLLDKTGTLTGAELEVGAIDTAPAASPAAAGEMAAWRSGAQALARWSSHPAARSVAALGDAAAAAPGAGWLTVHEQPGQGIVARDAQGVEWRLGRSSWVDGGLPEDDGSVWLGVAGRARLRFELREALRADALQTVERLRAAGIRIGIVSGDGADRVARVGRELAIDDLEAAATPASKLARLADAQRAGEVVAMVGDGLNDAPVLARSDVSIAFAHGVAVNRQQADAVLLGERLAPLADAVLHARRTLGVIRANLAWAVAYNAACIPLALAGQLPPWAAGLGMAASSLLVVLNATRLGRVRASGAG